MLKKLGIGSIKALGSVKACFIYAPTHFELHSVFNVYAKVVKGNFPPTSRPQAAADKL
jgi:hypothetical protein